jgi:hypothetical protein
MATHCHMPMEVCRRHPETMLELVQAVEDVATNIDAGEIPRACRSVKRRAQACWEAGGGHFYFRL